MLFIYFFFVWKALKKFNNNLKWPINVELRCQNIRNINRFATRDRINKLVYKSKFFDWKVFPRHFFCHPFFFLSLSLNYRQGNLLTRLLVFRQRGFTELTSTGKFTLTGWALTFAFRSALSSSSSPLRTSLTLLRMVLCRKFWFQNYWIIPAKNWFLLHLNIIGQ